MAHTMQHDDMQSATMEACISACLNCHRSCEQRAIHCLTMGDAHAAADHQRTMRDCAQICMTSADFMLRGSAFHAAICGVCADICDRCAIECDQLGGVEMAACAEACRRCAESCRAMAQAA